MSLLGRFSVMGVVVVAALGLAIGLVLKHQIEMRAQERAVGNALVIAQVGLETQLQPADLRYPNTLERLNQLDREVGTRFFAENGIMRVKLFNPDLRLVYSDDRTIIGSYAIKGGNVGRALEGEVLNDFAVGTNHDGTGGRTFEVYVPVRLSPGGEPAGVLEIYMSYEPVAREIREDVLLLVIMLGGDEFAVLVAGAPDRSAVIDLATRLQDALRRPFALRGVAVELEASIGVALYPEHGTSIGRLLQRADVAMYDAKRGRRGVATYTADRDPYSADRLGLLAELRTAIERDELILHYQPKVSLETGELVGVEALVRWQHPVRGLLFPDAFIPLAERTGAVADLTRWVVDRALAECRGLDLPVAVNLAAANIVDVTLPAAIGAALERHDVPADRLVCEISEHTVMADPVRASDVLDGLRALGVGLSLDDFGTGHSSLSYLKRLPLDEVKIDRSFVAGMTEDENDAVIVRSTIDLARNLGLRVVAEGVESAEIMDALAELCCDVAQGYFISRPMELQALSVNLRGPARKPRSSSALS
jgi:EAL domain-containing protein (putative c-di-GMP-specific phosphodiesterase class I)